MSTPTLPAWPPSLPDEAREYLSTQATDYALAHGIVYRPVPVAPSTQPASDSAIHAPFSLFPSPFPRALFQKAQNIQPAYDLLYAQVSSDHTFLQRVIGESVVQVDEFQKQLWDIYVSVKDDLVQPLSLGLFRSDYLLHDAQSESSAAAEMGRSGQLELKQVEFNTISASFGALCTKVNGLHRHVSQTTDYLDVHSGLSNLDNLPVNQGQDVLTGGLAAAHAAYISQRRKRGETDKNTYVLFVVQEGERNAFDQRPLEHALQDRGIRVVRQCFNEIAARMSSDEKRALFLQHPVLGRIEISVVYFRAGYGPSDYTGQTEWETRKKLELSAAIKCPSIAVQLAGAKKVQQVLAEPGQLEPLLGSLGSQAAITPATAQQLRETFTDLYPLDDSPLGQKGYQLALTQPQNYVLKPQREGGGNNVYRDDIPRFLAELESSSSTHTGAIAKRQAYILMSLIKPPAGLGNFLVKAATTPGTKAGALLAKDTVSELGVYGAVLFENGQQSVQVHHHQSGGYLLRTKGRESDEGGVAVGFSVIDSPLLV
ncbi:hypothetical protein EX895_002864 [Sporisorium graminicola]|uniref:Glutathione synthetase n=1 Tax=Sporisorium graminicola TaxID=280036 RepID=A0A4U7KU73_9BASI|nr:hypothetical protein EX895_002864 [Sporisorium graminicola]TKY88154.1 hypothetical protein EX895_002864 [Sporisorium graminicola]